MSTIVNRHIAWITEVIAVLADTRFKPD